MSAREKIINRKLKDIEKQRNKVSKEYDKLVKKIPKKYDLTEKEDFTDVYKILKQQESIFIHLYKEIKHYFKSGNKFLIFMYTKDKNMKVFKVVEDGNISGFRFREGYYNIERNSVLKHNRYNCLFYFEDNALPIDFTKISVKNDDKNEIDFVLETNPKGLMNVVNGQAFKAIANLGKEPLQLNWMYMTIALGIIALTVLQLTGQIDLMSMMNLQ